MGRHLALILAAMLVFPACAKRDIPPADGRPITIVLQRDWIRQAHRERPHDASRSVGSGGGGSLDFGGCDDLAAVLVVITVMVLIAVAVDAGEGTDVYLCSERPFTRQRLTWGRNTVLVPASARRADGVADVFVLATGNWHSRTPLLIAPSQTSLRLGCGR